MTRINCVPPEELSDKHLFAEIRELPRVRNLQPRVTVPLEYRLWTGHVLFFMNKGRYLEKRHKQLINNWNARGFTTSIPPLRLGWECEFMLDWEPDEKAMEVNRKRINDRIRANPSQHRWTKKS